MARIAKAAEEKQKRREARRLSKQRTKTSTAEKEACDELRQQLKAKIKRQQMTSNLLETQFGAKAFGKCCYRLPNRKFDYDHIEIKTLSFSRGNDFLAPLPINVSVTFDWQNPVKTVKGTATEKFECLRLHGLWKIRDL